MTFESGKLVINQFAPRYSNQPKGKSSPISSII